MDTNPDEEFSPNSYLLRACSGPQQAASSGKETCCLNVRVRVRDNVAPPGTRPFGNEGWGEGGVGGVKVKHICHFVNLRFQDTFVEVPNKAFALCVSHQGLVPLRWKESAALHVGAGGSPRGPAERQWNVRFLYHAIPVITK